MNNATGGLVWLALFTGYWVPAIVAGIRRVPNLGSVIVVNLLLGWTFIGWIIALAMACRTRPQPAGPFLH